MSRKLRKTLGNVNDALVQELMNLIDTQSKATVARWCAEFAADVVLPIYEKHIPDDDRPRRMLAAAIDCAEGKIKFADVKNIRVAEWTKPPELWMNPVAMAAARAIIDTACMVWQTPTHSLGCLWYAGAAVAYDRLGLDATDAEYDAVANEVLAECFERLKAVAVPNEPKPLNCKWGC
ncbi:MAG: hypothetical protein LBN02_09680 [Oscillospiraceae bacterium]|jgi:hypothetical protein|nr:hypothetical protein [Oscillospiraceae bacterium]